MSDDQFPTVVYGSRRGSRIWWVVGAAFVLVLILGAIALRIAFASLPPGTTVAGMTVRSPTQVRMVAREVSQRLSSLPVELQTSAGSTTVPAADLGAMLATDDLEREAVEGTGADAWINRFTGGGVLVLPVDVSVGGTDIDAVVDAMSTAPVDGAVTIASGQIDTTDPVVGIRVTADQIRAAVTPQLVELADAPVAEWPSPLTVSIDGEAIEPDVTQASVDTAVAELERIAESQVEVTAAVVPEDAQTLDGVGVPTREEVSISLTGAELLTLLAINVDPDAIQAQRLRILADPSNPPQTLIDFLDDAAVVPDMSVTVLNRSATPPRTGPDGAVGTGPGGPADQPRLADVSQVTGDLVAEVREPGLAPDVPASIDAIVQAAVEGEPTAEIQGTEVTDADPALLGILAPVSTYTTFYTPGEGRVTNIHRIAEIVDNTLVPPGGNLDVNHAVGERTEADGFVPSGAILEGEFITDVGGGVSQFGTTFFNAMWFAGLDIITHTPHSYWFDRYPAGREATIDYPGVNLEFNNNTPYWILVDTAITDDSVTVTFWSTPYFQVEQSILPREPFPGGDFSIPIERVASAPAVADPRHPDEQIPAFVDDDRFVQNYGTPP